LYWNEHFLSVKTSYQMQMFLKMSKLIICYTASKSDCLIILDFKHRPFLKIILRLYFSEMTRLLMGVISAADDSNVLAGTVYINQVEPSI
jgi:hypothetical protein